MEKLFRREFSNDFLVSSPLNFLNVLYFAISVRNVSFCARLTEFPSVQKQCYKFIVFFLVWYGYFYPGGLQARHRTPSFIQVWDRHAHIGKGHSNTGFIIFMFVFCLYYWISGILNFLHFVFEKRKLWSVDLIPQSTRLDCGFRWVHSRMLSILSSRSSRRVRSGSPRFKVNYSCCNIRYSCREQPTLIPIYLSIEMFLLYL